MAEENTSGTDEATADRPANPKRKSRRKWYLLGLALVFIILAVAYALYYFLYAQFYAATDDAYVHGNRVTLAPQISGTVTSIYADDTDRVTAGDTLINLDDTDARNALAMARAQLAETVRSVHQLFVQVNQQQAVVDERETALAQARRDYHRDRRLIKAHAVTRQKFEQSRSTYDQDKSTVNAAHASLAKLKAQTDGTTLSHHPRVQQAEAQLRSAYLALARTRIPAPVTGYIAQRDVQLGQQVTPSNPMLSIVPTRQVWVDANYKETELASMRIGQSATVTSDFYGGDVVYHGHVAGISAGTGSAFELLPAQNATGNWIKIVRRVPVRIVLNQKDIKKHPLRLGLSMHVTVNLHDTSGPMLAKKTPNKPRYRTQIYKKRLAGAQQMIVNIVNANDGNPKTRPKPSKTADSATQDIPQSS